MSTVLRLPGRRALSDFRLDKLLHSARKAFPAVRGLHTQTWHFVKLRRALDRQERQVLEALLTYGPKAAPEDLRDDILLVVPRLGTISPWSSKATDIAHQCGLEAVERIERGTALRFEMAPGARLSDASRQALLPAAARSHDRNGAGRRWSRPMRCFTTRPRSR